MNLLRRHFGLVLGAITLTALVLGTVGFMQCSASCTVSTAVYRAVQMFYWNYFPWDTTAEAKLPWTLEVGRFLAPVATLGALVRVGIALSHKRWVAFRVGRLQGHTIICGAGRKGGALAAQLEPDGVAVVMIEKQDERAEELSTQGALVIEGDATKEAVLLSAGVRRAARLVIATAGDHDNLTVALTAAHLVGATGKLAIHAHSSNSALCDLYQRNHAIASTVGSGVAVKVFNHFRDVARCTIASFPPDAPEGEAHVFLPDLGKLGTALAVEYALVGHFTRDRKVHLYVVGRDADNEVAVFRSRYPNVGECMDLTAVPLAPGGRFSAAVAAVMAKTGVADQFTVFAGLEDESHAFSHALELVEFTQSRAGVRILMPEVAGSSLRQLVENSAALKARIDFLPGPELTCSAEAIFGEVLDRTARQVHENWLKETRAQIESARGRGDLEAVRKQEAKATYREWDALSEEQKGASRSQADHIAFKLRAVGLNPATASQAEWARVGGEDIELMSRMEHARWAAYYWMTGWSYAPTRNDERKEHPDLVPYDELDEPTKDYDRAAVRNLGGYLTC